MGDSKLCLLLLLSTSALAVAQDGDQPTCLLAKRYKTLHRYEYLYEAESLNAINGASTLKNGPKASCKVEIEVPQTCSFIVRTTGCSLSEVVDMDAAGNPTFRTSPSSDAFAAEMERYPLKVVVEGVYDVKLYPEEGETTTILNVKRGIISALAVPLMEEDKNKNMPTIHGMCKTYSTVNAREDIATDISLERDLSRCDKFVPMKDHTSPLAIISGMHYPLAQLVRSSQTCNYKFDNAKKHMTSGSCTENHILIPFSHKGKYGVTNVAKQQLTLVQVSPHNDRVFDRSDIVKGLNMDAVMDKTVFQDKDALLNLLRELANLPEAEGERRANLFHKLVTMFRGMKTETMSPAIPEALAVSRVLTYQVLAQCGTPECSSAIMQILRGFDSSSLEVDATVFALGLVSNPSALLINDMLEMAKYKPSKPIMYALSNVVKRFYKTEEKLIPEIHSVAEFMAAQLGDCSGDKDHTFMTLRVIGNMAPAVVPASPALRAAVIRCVNQPAASPAVQQAAVQVYRLTPVPEEGRKVLMQVVLNNATPLQKRIAAYLVVMKSTTSTELGQIVGAISREQDKQFKSFVISHMTNILSSTEPDTQMLREMMRDVLQNNEIGPIMDPTKFSRNYKIGSVEGNMIFEGNSYLPKEVMLEMTLKAFGYDVDMMEIGMEGTGFEPTVDALFGENGFFPDTALKAMYFVSDNMPTRFREIVQNMLPVLKKDTRKVSQSLMREVGRNLNKLVRELKKAQSPEAMVYLRLLGNELGYLRTKEMEEMAYSAAMMIDSMFKMFPTDILLGLMTKADNTFFAHYIFMDNEFFLPTVTGVPLRIALSGTFTPGIKGGLRISRDMSEVAFMPSAGIEFVTRVGAHIPEYVDSGLEMHSNMFHESGLTAKISMGRDQAKLTIPAPKSPTKLIKMTNTLVAVTGSRAMTIPPMVTDKVDVSECTPFFTGMKYCSALQYIDAFSQEAAPYFPFTGDSKFVVELHPTGEVTEYTATTAYELLRGEDGKQKIDSVRFVLRAEAAEPTEARAIVTYNRKKHVIEADVQIPDFDMEAGLRLGFVDGRTKGKGTHSITLDIINKNIPQVSVVGRANLEAMKKGMLQVQLLLPSFDTDATITANMERDEELELELKSEIKVMEATSKHSIAMKYDDRKVEVELKSDVNAETTALQMLTNGNSLLDMEVGQTDMKVRHIFMKFVEAANNYMDIYGADIPYIQNFRVPDMPEISLPETLFLNAETKAVYHFNDEHFTMVLPVPLGGKSTEELRFPPALTTPHISLPMFGLEIVSMEIPIPEFFVPEKLTLSVPLFGKAEVSALMKSNLYDMSTSMAVGKDLDQTSSYSAKVDMKGTSPFDILSFKIEGSGTVATTDSVKAVLKSSFVHKFIEASISIAEDATVTDRINIKSTSKIEAKSPFGLNIDLTHNGVTDIDMEEFAADSSLQGMVTVGPIYGKTTSTQSFSIRPFKPELKVDSSVQLDSTMVKAQNKITATLVNGEFSFVSNTNAFEDIVTHVVDISFRDNKLSLKSSANALALGFNIRNQAQASAGAGEVLMRIETNADHSENRVYSLMTASVGVNGLAVSSDANVKLFENEAIHKATLTMNKDGLTTSGTTTLQSPLSLENTFKAGIDASRATLSFTNKAAMGDIKADNANTLTITFSSLDFNSKADVSATLFGSYTHDVIVDLKPYTASASINNNVKIFDANFINEAKLQAELYKMDLTGSVKAVFDEEEIKHVYQVNYADMTANAKCSTTGKLFGTHMSHNTELEIVGLSARITNDARFNSQPVRFDHSIRCSIVPFDFNLDAMFNADGDMTFYGKHSAQAYGKFLIKAQPLAFASSQECRASVTQKLDNGVSLDTTFDNKVDTLFTIQEQKISFTMKSKMNEHAFNQDVSMYNTAEKTGVEMSATVLTNIVNTASKDNQEFAVSGFLKYDKNTDSHIIQFPLMENVPVFLESIKAVAVQVAEALRSYLSNPEIVTKLEALPQHFSEFVSQLNVEGRVIQLKQYFSDFTQNFIITMEDVEASLMNLKVALEKLTADVTVFIQRFADMMKDIVSRVQLPEELITMIEKYDIKEAVVFVIDIMRETIKQIDLEKLRGTSMEFLSDIDNKYEIVMSLQFILRDLQESVKNFDLRTFVAELKKFIASINLQSHFEELVSLLPMELFSDITDKVKAAMQEFDIVGKVNTFIAKLRELIAKFEADQKIQVILEKAVELVKQFNTEETIRTVIKMVKDADIPTKFNQAFQGAIDYLKTTDVKEIVEQLRMYIETIILKLKTFNYNNFVDKANEVIAEYTAYVNEVIRALRIPQKLEAARDFANVVLSSAKAFMDRLREIKVAEMMKTVKEMFDQLIFEDLTRFFEDTKVAVTNMDVKAMITNKFKMMSIYYDRFMDVVADMFARMVDTLKMVLPEQKILIEIQQIINGLMTELRKTELTVPSFTVPFTDLYVPSRKFRVDNLQEIEIPSQLDIPEFTILATYTVKATTISFDDIKQRIIDLIDYIVNFEIKMPDVDAFFGDLTLNYLPSMPEMSLPEFTLPEVSFPTIPHVPVEKMVKSLQLPEIKLPVIPSEMMVPCFGTLRGEISLKTPIYAVKTSAEFKNSTETAMTPQFTGFVNVDSTSPKFEMLNYEFKSTAQLALPKMSRIVIAETVKFKHVAFGVDHQASLALYGLSAQAQAKTTMRVTTAPYTANLINTAFFAMEGGMSASLETTYNHVVDLLPLMDVKTDVVMTQKAFARQDGYTLTITVDNVGKGKLNAEAGNHKSNLNLSLSPKIVTLTFTGNTDSSFLKMKQQVTAECGPLVSFKFNVRNEADVPSIIKNSLIVASGHFSLYDMKAEVKANHDTEFYGAVLGVLSNGINILVRPVEFVFEFQNKGNAKVTLEDILIAKMDVQNDYLVNVKPDMQQMNTVTLVRLNQHKMFYNFTVDNSKNEAGIFVAMESEADLDFLTKPISIPETELPFVDFRIPAISNLNLYETGLKHILTTTKQNVDVDAKIIYQKIEAAPIVDMMGLIQIPAVGNLITELSFKSAIVNLNVNAGLYTEDDLVFRLGATTASVFECLKAKLDGTTSLTTKRGVKLANSLSLENRHVEGSHNSTLSVSTETLEMAVSVATLAKISLPVLSVEVKQNLVADTKTKAKAVSTLRMTSNFNFPVIMAVGKANGDHSVKLEGSMADVSVETSTRGQMDGTVWDDYLTFGVLDNEFNLYLKSDGVRSTSKIIADVKLTRDTTKLITMDVNENLDVEASLSRVYALMKCTGNNEVNLFDFNTKGKQLAQVTVDFAPMSSLTADIEIDVTQPSNLGDFTIFEKTVATVTAAKQKISTNGKFVSPVYTTDLVADIEGNLPLVKVTFKSSATSVIVFLEYDMDASSTVNFENEALAMKSKAVLTHTDFNMDVSQTFSDSRHTVNVDITSPTFTDMNLRYASHREAISASVSTPSSGFLGFNIIGRVLSQMSARFYGRYPSAPEVDVDIVTVKSMSKGADKMNLQIVYNMEAPKAVLSELKMKLPSIISTITVYADKYQIREKSEVLKQAAVAHISDVYNAVVNYDVQLSELSVFFRNTFVQYQKSVQVFLDAVVRFLRETKFQLPGSEEMTTLPEVLKKLTSSIAVMLDKVIKMVYENMEVYYDTLVEKISSVKVSMPVGDAVTVSQMFEQVKTYFRNILDQVVDFVKNMESLDTMLVKIGETQRAFVDLTQGLVDSVQSDYLDAVFFNINVFCRGVVTAIKEVVDQLAALDMELISSVYDNVMDMLMNAVDQINLTVYGLLQEASQEAQSYVKVNEGMLEIDLPFAFQQ